MITLFELDRVLVDALPELDSDLSAYILKIAHDPEFTQRFFAYSFIPTLQVALDQNIDDFCARAFALIEQLLIEGDSEVQGILREEFFDYGPACEKWMKRAEHRMGPRTRQAASSQ